MLHTRIMGHGQATSVYIYLSCYFVLTNTVFLNTTSGLRKLPEYFIFASHGKFKMQVKKNLTVGEKSKTYQVYYSILWKEVQ